jgi:hypothetical protein
LELGDGMNEESINEIFDKLKNRELSEFNVKKEDFLSVRKVLVSRVDFKHFRGIAHHGGDITYQYMDEPRS